MGTIQYETEELDGGVLLIQVVGQLDTETSARFFSGVEQEIENGHSQIILNCIDLSYISSYGLAMLMRVHSRMKKIGGDVKLARVRTTVSEILHIVGFNKLGPAKQ